MDALETRILTNMDGGLRNKIVYFCRYLDDILIFFKGKKEEFQTLMDYFNGFHESIKFTFEMDYENRTTHWLDCQITVENGTIVTDLYRKPEASRRGKNSYGQFQISKWDKFRRIFICFACFCRTNSYGNFSYGQFHMHPKNLPRTYSE